MLSTRVEADSGEDPPLVNEVGEMLTEEMLSGLPPGVPDGLGVEEALLSASVEDTPEVKVVLPSGDS